MRIKQALTVIVMLSLIVGAIVIDFRKTIRDNRQKVRESAHKEIPPLYSMHNKGYKILYIHN